jgi:hypothetical protein
MAFVSAFLSSLPASICVGRITSMSLIDEASFADDILNVLSMVKDHPFIQKVEQSKNNVPSIILYSYEQMTDFQKSIGTSKKKRVGIDGTFHRCLPRFVLEE